jgi:hypothetical protein
MCPTISEFYLWTLILFTFNNCVLLQKPSSGENPTFFNIGGVLSNGESEKNFSETIAVSEQSVERQCCAANYGYEASAQPSAFFLGVLLRVDTKKPNRIFIESEMKLKTEGEAHTKRALMALGV